MDEISDTNVLSLNNVGNNVLLPVKARFQVISHHEKNMKDDTIMCISNNTDFSFLGYRNILHLSSFQIRGVSR